MLAGGGSLGAVAVGVLREIVGAGERADLLVGASAGAIDCAYFAADPSPACVARLERLWRGLTGTQVFGPRWVSLVSVLRRGDCARRAAPDRAADGLRMRAETHPDERVRPDTHALRPLVIRQPIVDLQRYAQSAQTVVAPLCPLDVPPSDYSHGAEPIARAAASTRARIGQRGRARTDIPPMPLPHGHAGKGRVH